MRGRVREVVIYFKFHENRSRGLGAVGVENRPLPLTRPMAYKPYKPWFQKKLKPCHLSITVSPFIPNPLPCFKCQKLRHGQSACKGKTTCANCSHVGHTSTACENAWKCLNAMVTTCIPQTMPKLAAGKVGMTIKAENKYLFCRDTQTCCCRERKHSYPRCTLFCSLNWCQESPTTAE